MNPDDFACEVTAHRAHLLRVAQRVARCGRDDAEDAVQNALIRVRASAINLSKGTCRNYLEQAVRWEASRLYRRPVHESYEPEHIGLSGAVEPANLDANLWKDVEDAIQRLREQPRAVVQGRLEGYTLAAVGRQQGYTAQQAHLYWKEAIRCLREMLCPRR